MRRRLFERLEQRIERALGEHVHFVNQKDFELSATRDVLGTLNQFANIIDTVIGRGVNFHHIEVSAGVDILAGGALSAGFGTGALLAVETLGKDTGDSGFANAARTGKQEGMMDPAGFQRIGQCLDHMGLTDEF